MDRWGTRRRYLEAGVAGVGVLLPIGFMTFYIYHFGVDVPFRDGWQIPFLLRDMYTGQLTIGDFYAQHNVHRPLVPRLIILLVSDLTNLNTVALAFVSYLFLLLTAGLLWIQLYDDIDVDSVATATVLYLPILWVILSPRKHANLLQGWDVQTFLAYFAVVASLFLLNRGNRLDKYHVGAVLVAIVASFSRFDALLVWPIGAMMILLSSRNVRRELAFWGSAAGVTYLVYFIGWSVPGTSSSSISYVIFHPLSAFQFFLIVLGSPTMFFERNVSVMGVTPDAFLLLSFITVAGFLVTVILGLTILHLIRYSVEYSEYAVWFGLVAFAVLDIGMITVARSGLGIQYATSSRYTTVTSFLYIGLYVIGIKLAQQEYTRSDYHLQLSANYLQFLLAGLLILSVFVGYTVGVVAETNRSPRIEAASYSVLGYQNSSASGFAILQTPSDVPSRVRNAAQIMEKYNLGVFHRYENYLYAPSSAETANSNISGGIKFNGDVKFAYQIAATTNRSVIEFTQVRVPRCGELKFSIAEVVRQSGNPVPIQFEILIRSGNSTSVVFSEKLVNDSNRWHDVTVDLSAHAGKPVDIILVTSADAVDNQTYALWGNPRLCE